MKKFALFNPDGFPTAFYGEDVHGARTIPVYGDAPEPTEENPFPELPIIGKKDNPDCLIPNDAVEITEEQWHEFINNAGYRKWDGAKVIEYSPPAPEPEPVIIVLPAVTLWERTSKTEAVAIEAAMETQDARSRNIFRTAQTFRSDHELWLLLEQMAIQLFGEERAAELLAP